MTHELTTSQRERVERFGVAQSVDVHCHCLPGLDDGPGSLDEALGLCRALVRDGITAVVATPHQLGRYDRRNPGTVIREAVRALNDALTQSGVPLDVFPGADVRLDERILDLLDTREVLTLADAGRYLLLELPHESYIEPLPLVRALAAHGVRTIVSHPERHPAIARRPELVAPWLGEGALLQVTAASLAGDFGGTASRVAWELAGSGRVALVATDAHDIHRRPPSMSRAIELLERRLGSAAAKRMCLDNPLRVLRESGRPSPVRPAVATAPAAGRWKSASY